MTRIFLATLSNKYFQISIISILAVFLQVLLVPVSSSLPVNIALCTLVYLLTVEDIYEALFGSILIAELVSIFSAQSDFSLLYPLLAFCAVKFRPEQISEKFYICVFYTLLASLVFAFGSGSLIKAIISNLATVTPIYFLLNAIRSANPKT